MEGTHDTADEVHQLWGGVSRAINTEITRERNRHKTKIRNEARWSFINPMHLATVRLRLDPYLLTHIGLNFSNRKYFEFFNLVRSRPYNMRIQLNRLRCLEHLKQLDIKFRSPRWSSFKNCWTGPPFANTTLVRGAWVYQKIVTEMILTYALLEFRNIPKVTVEGYVKTSTKMNFDAALREFQQNNQQATPNWQTWNMTKAYASFLAAHAK